jgi:hypothetical protein
MKALLGSTIVKIIEDDQNAQNLLDASTVGERDKDKKFVIQYNGKEYTLINKSTYVAAQQAEAAAQAAQKVVVP